MKFLKNLLDNATDAGIGAIGGAGGRLVTNKVMPMVPLLKDYPKFHSVGTFLIGCAMMGNKQMHSVGFGMASTAGADFIGKMVPAVSPINAPGDELDMLADELAEELEARLADDVANANAAINDDVNNAEAAMNDDMDAVAGDDE